ncbi:MAG: hypothetical protein CBB72_006930 [Muricauda sp. TMED12]|nr:MAG: hypothetical protein CBB72_006930 [Muricauda sp. TMED12]
MALHISVDSHDLTQNEAESLATFFTKLATSAPVERPSYGNTVEPLRSLAVSGTSATGDSLNSAGVPVPSTVDEVEEHGEELPDLSQDEPKEVKSDSLVEEQNELDVNGLPWDKRIHSGKPTKNADGSWKKRRGVDDATFEKVVAELKGEVAETPDQSQVGFQSQQPAQPDQSQVGFQSQQTEDSAPPATNLTWPQVLQRMSAAGATQETIATGMATVGMAGRPLPELVNHPEKFNDFLTAIGA